MRENPLKKNSRFYLGMVLNVVEGMLSGFNFLLLYEAMKMLWNGTINSPSLLRLSLFLGGIFILRIVIYSIGYTQSQIGGAAVSNRTRLFLGDKIKRIPLSKFTQGQTGQYINIVTSDVNNYEKNPYSYSRGYCETYYILHNDGYFCRLYLAAGRHHPCLRRIGFNSVSLAFFSSCPQVRHRKKHCQRRNSQQHCGICHGHSNLSGIWYWRNKK